MQQTTKKVPSSLPIDTKEQQHQRQVEGISPGCKDDDQNPSDQRRAKHMHGHPRGRPQRHLQHQHQLRAYISAVLVFVILAIWKSSKEDLYTHGDSGTTRGSDHDVASVMSWPTLRDANHATPSGNRRYLKTKQSQPATTTTTTTTTATAKAQTTSPILGSESSKRPVRIESHNASKDDKSNEASDTSIPLPLLDLDTSQPKSAAPTRVIREIYPPTAKIVTVTNATKHPLNIKNATPKRRESITAAFMEEDPDAAHCWKRRIEEEDETPPPNEYCVPWGASTDMNHNNTLDEWWQQHPEYDVGAENETHACLQRIVDPRRITFLRQVHALQFPCHREACSNLAVRHLYSAHGFASTFFFHLMNGFWSALRQGRPFQVGLHPPSKNYRWMYTPEYTPKGDKQNINSSSSSWAACPTQDHECYYLPISNCTRPVEVKDDIPKKGLVNEPLFNDTLAEQNMWMSQYLMRPRLVLRRNFYDFMKRHQQSQEESQQQTNEHDNDAVIPTFSTPCTWMHVRRTDAMTEVSYKRNFYRLDEYLKRGKVQPGETILLLTDDETTIEEATLLHPNYNWVYLNKTRHRGPAEYASKHVVSNDPVQEVLHMLAEQTLAGQCHKGVHGKSNMIKLFRNGMLQHVQQQQQEMQAATDVNSLNNITMIRIDGKLLQTRVEPQDFMAQLEKDLEEARKRRISTT